MQLIKLELSQLPTPFPLSELIFAQKSISFCILSWKLQNPYCINVHVTVIKVGCMRKIGNLAAFHDDMTWLLIPWWTPDQNLYIPSTINWKDAQKSPFRERDTKLDSFLTKNYHSPWKYLYLANRHSFMLSQIKHYFSKSSVFWNWSCLIEPGNFIKFHKTPTYPCIIFDFFSKQCFYIWAEHF